MTRRRRRLLAVAAGALVLAGGAPRAARAAPPSERILDAFDDVAAWTAVASDGVQASVHPAAGPDGGGLRLDFDLGGTAGYAAAHRALPFRLPPRFELSFDLRADAPVNAFQLKLVDASGENVWWVNRPDYEWPRAWRRIRIRPRHIGFAWGPTKDRTLRDVASVEFVVAAGRGGGRGAVYVRRLALRELPDDATPPPAPVVTASSSLPGAEPPLALDGDAATAWRSDPAAGRAQHLVVDFQRPRELGGLVVRWRPRAHASRYDVELSDDGAQWRLARRVTDGRGGADAVRLPEEEARFVRLRLHDGPARAYAIAELEVRDPAFGASSNAFFEALAREAPRGAYPRGFSGEQATWTLVGVDGGRESGLLSADGALEVARGCFSIEPFVVVGPRVVTWADVAIEQALHEGDLPIPSVTWRAAEWTLRVTAFASGTRDRSRLVARYDVTNATDRALRLDLVLAARPFQVNPPAQLLNIAGGVSAIHDVRWDGVALRVNDERRVLPLSAPDRAVAWPFEAGPLTERLADRPWRGAPGVHDDTGYASAALAYRLALPPHATRTVGVVVPLAGEAEAPRLGGLSPAAWIAREQAAVAAAWRARVDRVAIDVPPAGRPLVAALRTALAHILITRDGPVLRPGTRAYARSWIRDGAMIAESLLRLDHAAIAADYLRWYAARQFANGKVPCCIDERGADPVPEHDSAGEFLFLAAEAHRYTGDRALLDALWPRIDAAVRYLDALRRSERTEANRRPDTRAFFGILPPSISHEGYAEKPMHSYWDDFWALKGYESAVAIARALGRDADARRWEAARDEFRGDLAASLAHAVAHHGIDYLPGSAELGDFDPTSSTIAVAPAGELSRLPPALVTATFERYWREFVDRRDGRAPWRAYTPYELRHVGTFVRLGWRDRAHALLAFFLAGRRPAAWNQWPEVIGRDARPRFIGDLPHAWVASDFIRSVLDLFAYERDGDRALVLGAGIPPAWLDGPGVAVRGLRTPYGPLAYTLRRERRRLVLQVAGGLRVPPGGLVYAGADGAERRIDTVPAKLAIEE
jgi:hypothetical protein